MHRLGATAYLLTLAAGFVTLATGVVTLATGFVCQRVFSVCHLPTTARGCLQPPACPGSCASCRSVRAHTCIYERASTCAHAHTHGRARTRCGVGVESNLGSAAMLVCSSPAPLLPASEHARPPARTRGGEGEGTHVSTHASTHVSTHASTHVSTHVRPNTGMNTETQRTKQSRQRRRNATDKTRQIQR